MSSEIRFIFGWIILMVGTVRGDLVLGLLRAALYEYWKRGTDGISIII